MPDPGFLDFQFQLKTIYTKIAFHGIFCWNLRSVQCSLECETRISLPTMTDVTWIRIYDLSFSRQSRRNQLFDSSINNYVYQFVFHFLLFFKNLFNLLSLSSLSKETTMKTQSQTKKLERENVFHPIDFYNLHKAAYA